MTYMFDGKECRVYDDNKVNYDKAKSVVEDEEFWKNVYAVNYIHKINNIETPSLPNSGWSLTQEKEEEVKVIFSSQTEFGIIRPSNIRSLNGKRWLNLEILDGVFKFMFRTCVKILNYITMEPSATESLNSNYLKEKLPEHTNILMILIPEKHRWLSIVLLLKWESHDMPRFYVCGNKTQIFPENAEKLQIMKNGFWHNMTLCCLKLMVLTAAFIQFPTLIIYFF